MNVLIPAYKPDRRLIELTEELTGLGYNVIVVNDGSGADYDGIFDALSPRVTLLGHDVNRGKGRAMKTGFEYIVETAHDKEGVIIANADGQHLCVDITRVRDKLIENPHCLIAGCRKFEGNVPFRSRFGNAVTKYVFALASGVKLSDTQTGLRGIPFCMLKTMAGLKGERYEYEMNMLLHATENRIKIIEVQIKTVYIEGNASSHFNVLKDSLKIYAVIFKFVFSSFASFIIDYGMFVLLLSLTSNISNDATALLISTAGARVVSSLCNYIINRNIVFKGNKSRGSLLKYYLVVVIVMACSYGLTYLFSIVMGMSEYIAKIIAEIIMFAVSYVFQRMFVFKPSGDVVIED